MEEVILHGWVARDKKLVCPEKGDLYVGNERPIRRETDGFYDFDANNCLALPEHLFPEITWESGPKEVDMIIRQKGGKPAKEKKSVLGKLVEVFTVILSAGSLVLLFEIFKYVKSLIETLD